MSTFTASNGYGVALTGPDVHDAQLRLLWGSGAEARVCAVSTQQIDALREFFRAEEDERLGRWRWPDSPRYVVRPSDFDETYTYVFDEETFELWGVNGFDDTKQDVPGVAREAARAYFDAHPEPKPWHDAAEGEVWVLMFPLTSHVWFVNGDFFQNTKTLTNIAKTDPSIVSGRRIWPEDAS